MVFLRVSPLPRQTKPQTNNARRLRKSMSESQRRLWYELRAHRIGFHFKREVPFGPYTLDFYCHEAALCVEVDGEQHDPATDKERDAYLAANGILTLRYTSRDCFTDQVGVAKDVLRVCIERTGRDPLPPPPQPSPKGEGADPASLPLGRG
jgi:very-short-patch-repair endonuclease